MHVSLPVLCSAAGNMPEGRFVHIFSMFFTSHDVTLIYDLGVVAATAVAAAAGVAVAG